MTDSKPVTSALLPCRVFLLLFLTLLTGCDDFFKKDEGPDPGYQMVSTFAGNAQSGFADGIGQAARFNRPGGMVVDDEGNLYVADYSNHSIRKITSDGVVNTFAGTGQAGEQDGHRSEATFHHPYGLAMDRSGNLYVGDVSNHRIRKISPDGMVSTLAGKRQGYSDRKGEMAMFDHPHGVTVDATGNVYVADSHNNRIRRIAPDGSTQTIAGNGQDGFVDGAALSAEFFVPVGIVIDNGGVIYVADEGNSSVRKIDPDGHVTTMAGNGKFSFSDGVGRDAIFNAPGGISIDADGNLYVADYFNNCVRKVSPLGEVRKIAGNLEKGFSDGPPAEAEFHFPFGIAVDSTGTVYVADHFNHSVRKIN